MATDDQTQTEHPHHVEESWVQPIMGLSTIFLGLGIFFIGKSLGNPYFVNPSNMTLTYVGLLLIILFFIIFGLALYNETSPKRFAQRNQAHEERMNEFVKKPRGFAKFSFIWIFLASETLFFTLIIGASLVMRVKSNGYNYATGNWIPSQHLNVLVTAANTFVLIVSSYTMVKGLQWIEKGDSKKAGKYLFATFFLGLTFVSVQAVEYLGLWADGFRPGVDMSVVNPLFPSTFYLQTGFHGLHVLFGVFIMFFIALKTYRGGYTAENHDSVELIGYYWHFVDLVWIILFTFVYLF